MLLFYREAFLSGTVKIADFQAYFGIFDIAGAVLYRDFYPDHFLLNIRVNLDIGNVDFRLAFQGYFSDNPIPVGLRVVGDAV